MPTESCPGCYSELEESDGPTHRYIGASAGCWDVYTRLLAGEPPMSGTRLSPLFVDPYAAQHPGDTSPQATQSVAVHLVVLEVVLNHGMSLDLAVPMRVAAVEVGRKGSGYPRLEPVPASWDLTIADIAGERSETERGEAADGYVRSVWETWNELHGALIQGWHRSAAARITRS